jgi:ketopantoate reductase
MLDLTLDLVVQSPEDAANQQTAFDYVILCVKALPDIYNLADIIQSVVTPQHTCILVNTTNTLGVERHLEDRFNTNVVLSLVSGANLTQLGSSEFEHSGSTEVWVGPASFNSTIPEAIQKDMSEALAMTLTTGQVDCKVSDNIRQQQFERMIGYAALPSSLGASVTDTAIDQLPSIPPASCSKPQTISNSSRSPVCASSSLTSSGSSCSLPKPINAPFLPTSPRKPFRL